jgi:hypothetical protein
MFAPVEVNQEIGYRRVIIYVLFAGYGGLCAKYAIGTSLLLILMKMVYVLPEKYVNNVYYKK